MNVTFTASKKRYLPEIKLTDEQRKNHVVSTWSEPHPDPKWARHATIWKRACSDLRALKGLYADDSKFQRPILENSFFRKIIEWSKRKQEGAYFRLPYKDGS